MTSRFVNYSKIFYANFETTDILGEYFFKRTFMWLFINGCNIFFEVARF